MSTPTLAQFLRQDCQLNLKQINEFQLQNRLREGISTWFAQHCPLPNTDYLGRFALLSDLLLDGQTVQFSGQLDELAKWQFFLSALPELGMVLPPVKKLREGWLFPILST